MRMLTHLELDAKRAMWRRLTDEMSELTGRFLSNEEQLRVRSLGEEIDELDRVLLFHDVTDEEGHDMICASRYGTHACNCPLAAFKR